MTRDTSHTIAQIAEALGLLAWGDVTLRVTRAAAPHEAGPDALALASTETYAAALSRGAARTALLWEGADPQAYGLRAALFAPRPRFALAGLSALMDQGPELAPGIHPTAIIDPSAEIGPDAAIGPFVVVGARARIGAGARIAAHCSVGADVTLGAQALLMERVTLGARCHIGDRLIAQPGAVVGADGFSFVTPEESAVEVVGATLGDAKGLRQQSYARIHSLGAVSIGDNVELGANSCIDRGTLTNTRIGDGTKLDNLVHVGHNV
ncbi:MAG: UDP-3-O-(3-hydroxymyristoyl)glucosamine N-acyltransferase, partial [Pseudomonadota bacterium]